MNAPARETLRRGWCPSTLRPMESGDGWLVRLHPPGGSLTPAQLCRVAALAQQHGNGLIEISGRGNLQLRGVRHEAHPELVAALLADRLVDERVGDGPTKLCLTSPLAGHDPSDHLDAAVLADALETGARGIAGLPAKISIVVDGGGALSLDGFEADLRLRALGPDRIAIGLPHGLWLGPVARGGAIAAALVLLLRLAELHAGNRDGVRRLRNLPEETLATACGLPQIEAPTRRPAPPRAGMSALRGGANAVLLALPFGRSDAAMLARLGQIAAASADTIHFSPWRGLAILGLHPEAARALLARAAELGLITGDDDPRFGITACSGKPACLRGETDAMADAGRLAETTAALLAAGVTLHVSGCVKSCANPGKADLTLVGADGGYRLAIGGTARDAIGERLDLSAILPRLQPGQELFQCIGTMRLSGRRQ